MNQIKENLVEKIKNLRKRMGIYYTPYEITRYISKNTIEPYITDIVNEKYKTNYKNVCAELLNKNQFNDKEIEIIKFIYFNVLKNLKICDNACGSGNFLIDAGKLILRIYNKVIKILEENRSNDDDVKEILKDLSKSPSRNYYIVRQIITNNLYGVDIMRGAVEIAKLRFWLWLISQIDPKEVEDKRIETLPNLDFNLMVGNSLIGFVDIEDVDFSKMLRESKKIKKALYEFKGFENFKVSNDTIAWLKDLVKRKQEFKTLPPEKAIKIKEGLEKELEKAREFLNEKFYELLKAKKINVSKEDFLKLKPFHWGFEFYEVFDLEKPKEERGFDIIIGNPPYISKKKIDLLEKSIHPLIFKSCTGQYDYLVLFIERSIKILNKFGVFGYIASNKFLASEYGLGIRKMLFENVNLTKIIDVSHFQVFEGVGVYPILVFFKNLSSNENYVTIGRANEGDIEKNRIKEVQIEKKILLDLSKNYVITTAITSKNIEIMKFLSKFQKLGEEIIYCGIAKSGFSKLIKTYEKLSENQRKNAKMILQSEDVDRFFVSYKNKWISSSITNKNQWSSFNSKKIVIAGIGFNIRAGYDTRKAALGRVYYIPENLVKNKFKVNPLVLLAILNSRLLDFYFSTLYISVHQAGGYLRYNIPYLASLPIVIPSSQKTFTIFTSYMLFLNETEKWRNSEKTFLEFIDKQIIDSLVYELYLKEKFEKDGLKTNLLQLVEPYLKDIENLKSDEEKLKTIKQVVEKIKSDSKIMKEIEKIKNHKWVRIIEGKER